MESDESDGTKPRRHHHFRITVSYADREQSAKVFINRELAEKFAARQNELPVVKSAEIAQLD